MKRFLKGEMSFVTSFVKREESFLFYAPFAYLLGHLPAFVCMLLVDDMDSKTRTFLKNWFGSENHPAFDIKSTPLIGRFATLFRNQIY